MSDVFRQTDGQIGAVVKAILMDPEARQGDDPTRSSGRFGRIRERHLLNVALMRALGCQRAIRSIDDPGRPLYVGAYAPLSAESVFNFYPPDHRAAGCEVDLFKQAWAGGVDRVVDLMEARLYRGRLSPVLRQAFREALADHPDSFADPVSAFALLLQLAMVSPPLGAVR